MNKVEYNQYIHSEHWIDFRNRYKQSDRPQKCVFCDSTRFELHHLGYKNIWRETFDDVRPLCPEHHAMVHKLHRMNKIPLEEFERVSVLIKPGRIKRRKKKKKPNINLIKEQKRIQEEYRAHIRKSGQEIKNKPVKRYFVFGRDVTAENVFYIGTYYTNLEFHRRLLKLNVLSKHTKFDIYEIQEDYFLLLKTNPKIKEL
jgi:hypothetical protein